MAWKLHLHRFPDGSLNGQPYVTDELGDYVCQLFLSESSVSKGPLIAAAPDLLDACKDMQRVLRAGSTGRKDLSYELGLAQAAINKALGQ